MIRAFASTIFAIIAIKIASSYFESTVFIVLVGVAVFIFLMDHFER